MLKGVGMGKPLDLRGVRIYSNTKNDIKDAIDLIGQEVYMSDYDVFFPYHKCELIGATCIKDDPYYGLYPFICNGEDTIHRAYKYFILAKDAKFVEEGAKEKKLRPYKNISEFCNETGCEEVGVDTIVIRNKDSKLLSVLLYTGYSDDIVCLGGYIFTFADLLKNYEYALNSFEWLPFGVLEDDEA